MAEPVSAVAAVAEELRGTRSCSCCHPIRVLWAELLRQAPELARYRTCPSLRPHRLRVHQDHHHPRKREDEREARFEERVGLSPSLGVRRLHPPQTKLRHSRLGRCRLTGHNRGSWSLHTNESAGQGILPLEAGFPGHTGTSCI